MAALPKKRPGVQVKLSEYEKALNCLNKAPLAVDRQVCRAFREFQDYIARLERDLESAKDRINDLEYELNYGDDWR